MEDEAARPGDGWENVPPKGGCRSRSIEAHDSNRRMGFEETGKLIRDSRRQDDVGVEAALSGTGLQNVPEADAASEELRRRSLGFRAAKPPEALHEMQKRLPDGRSTRGAQGGFAGIEPTRAHGS